MEHRHEPAVAGRTVSTPFGVGTLDDRRGCRHGTLLGPEGSDVSSTASDRQTPSRGSPEGEKLEDRGFTVADHLLPSNGVNVRVHAGVGCGGGAARILRTAQWTRASLISVVKFLRAHGGCLGSRSRRRTL